MLLLATQALPQLQAFRHPNLGRLITPGHFPRLQDTLADGFKVAADNECFHRYDPAAIAKLFSKIAPVPSTAARWYRACPDLWDRPVEIHHADGTIERKWTPPPVDDLPEVHPNLMWVAVPDVIRCACGAEEFCPESERTPACSPIGDADATLDRFGLWHLWISHLPLAFVLQDGAERPGRVPWDAAGLRAVFLGGSDAWRLGPDAAALIRTARSRGLYAHMGRVNSAKRLRYARSIGCTSIDGGKWVRWRDRYLRGGLELCSEPEPPSPTWQLQLTA